MAIFSNIINKNFEIQDYINNLEYWFLYPTTCTCIFTYLYYQELYIYYIPIIIFLNFIFIFFVKNIKATKFTIIYVLNKTIIKTIDPLNHVFIFRIKLTTSVVCTYKPIKYLDHLRMSVLSLLVHFSYLHVTLSLSIIKTFLLFV